MMETHDSVLPVTQVVLYGAGAAGTYVLKHLRSKGVEPLIFADNDAAKQGTDVMGVRVISPVEALKLADNYATWIPCAISRPAAKEIRAHLKTMNVSYSALWANMEVFHGIPPESAYDAVYEMLDDEQSRKEWRDQVRFRAKPDLDWQLDCSPKEETYFPPFIKHRADEVFIDCGAADGDSCTAFRKKWEDQYQSIVAFEPDQKNYNQLIYSARDQGRTTSLRMGVSDHEDYSAIFAANGDKSSHLGLGLNLTSKVRLTTLDAMCGKLSPTYIKMDIEGAELEALWGARKLIKDHSPVLAICAYHTSDHLWQIPMLIKAINPSYQMVLRRYAEGAWELVWYAVPTDRIIKEAL